MTRKELNRFLKLNYNEFPCTLCKRYDELKACDMCHGFAITDKEWKEYSKPDIIKKALDLACDKLSQCATCYEFPLNAPAGNIKERLLKEVKE